MKAVFSVGGESDGAPGFPPSYDIVVCFNGVPGTVILEVHETVFDGYSGDSQNPVTTQTKQSKCVMRVPLQSSHARAIASAILSAATEAQVK